MRAGADVSWLSASGQASVDMRGGRVSWLQVYDQATVTLTGADQISWLVIRGDAARVNILASNVHYGGGHLSGTCANGQTFQFWALRDLGKAQVERAAGATRAARQDVRLAVTAAYYDVLRAQALSKVAAEAQRMARAESDRARARAELGSAMRVDVARAEAQVAEAAQQADD